MLISRLWFLLLSLVYVSAEHVEVPTAPFIFNELASLLTQWPSTWHPNGHTIVPGELAPFTTLYHARKDDIDPTPSPEWLAFDAEMSYAVMASKIPGPTYLRTYRTTQPARVLYFNGMSAAWGPGWLDTQHAVITGQGAANATQPSWWDDYGRAKGLCDYAAPRGVDGIVRMNGGFEVIWCDFASPNIELVSSLNITPPDTQPGQLPQFPPFPPPDRDTHILVAQAALQDGTPSSQIHEKLPGDRPHRPPGRGPHGGWWQPAPLARSGNYEWLRASSRRPFTPQPHITLFHASLVTFYHPRLTSLAPSRINRTMTTHRAWEAASDADVRSVLDELDDVLSREPEDMRGVGVDWQAVARDVISGWADRIAELDAVLAAPSDNATALAVRVRALSYSPLSTYMEPGAMPGASGRELFNAAARGRCETSATGFVRAGMKLTPQERLLRDSLDAVVRRICDYFGALFAESWDVVVEQEMGKEEKRALTAQWQTRMQDLIYWLDWPAWLRCEEVCPWDSVCTMPVWPIAWGRWGQREGPDEYKLREELRPKCMSLDDMGWM